jgi:putative flippase GtrA
MTNTQRRDGLPGRIVRFALVGGLSTLAYGACAWLAVDRLRLSPLVATLLAYLLVIPLNFLLQRSFAFRSAGTMRHEIPRFIVVHGLNMGASFVAMWSVTVAFGLDYRWGILATMCIVPALVFIALEGWVFRAAAGTERQRRNRA